YLRSGLRTLHSHLDERLQPILPATVTFHQIVGHRDDNRYATVGAREPARGVEPLPEGNVRSLPRHLVLALRHRSSSRVASRAATAARSACPCGPSITPSGSGRMLASVASRAWTNRRAASTTSRICAPGSSAAIRARAAASSSCSAWL